MHWAKIGLGPKPSEWQLASTVAHIDALSGCVPSALAPRRRAALDSLDAPGGASVRSESSVGVLLSNGAADRPGFFTLTTKLRLCRGQRTQEVRVCTIRGI